MKVQRFFKKSNLCRAGVTLGSGGLTFVVVESQSGNVRVVDYGALANASHIENLEQLKVYLRPKMHCHFALPYRSIMLKNLRFSESFKEHEIEKIISLNAHDYFSCPAADLALDFEFLDNTKNRIRVLAGKKEEVNYWRELFAKNTIGLRFVAADVLAFERFLNVYSFIEAWKIYVVVLQREHELLQMVVINNRVDQVRVSALSNMTTENIVREIAIFLRVYDSQCRDKVVTDLLIFGVNRANL